MLRLSGVIFDLDGVLWHSSDAHAAAYAGAFGEAGILLPLGFYSIIAGETTRAGVARLLELYTSGREGDKELGEQLCRRKQSLAAVELAHIQPAPEVLPALQALRARGYKLALATSASRNTMELFLRRSTVAHVFDATVCGEDVLKGKPSPDIFIEAAARLSISVGECVAVEDSRSGIIAARACGMSVIGYRVGDLEEGESLLTRCGSLSSVAAWLGPLRNEA